jgi:tripartite-type tricarboxylate transporter receptor subunit TctC
MKSNSNRRWLCAAAMILAFAPFTPSANAVDYPSRPVKVITQGAAGSGPDVIARLIAEELGRLWRQQVVIVNHPGAGGVLAARCSRRARRLHALYSHHHSLCHHA